VCLEYVDGVENSDYINAVYVNVRTTLFENYFIAIIFEALAAGSSLGISVCVLSELSLFSIATRSERPKLNVLCEHDKNPILCLSRKLNVLNIAKLHAVTHSAL
jgi:hypothetical protein